MGSGLKAWWLTLASGGILSMIAVLGARWVGGLSRRTEIDKMYMAELVSVRAERDAARRIIDEKDALIDQRDAVIDELRKQHLLDMPCSEREKHLQARVIELIENERRLQTRLDEFLQRFIGAKEPPGKG